MAIKNETLCRLLAHNLCAFIQEQHELGIDPVFWQDKQELVIADAPPAVESDCYELRPVQA